MKRVLIVVDYQNDFVSGSLGFLGAEKLEAKIISFVKEFEESNDIVVFTMDTHDSGYLDTVEGKRLPISHCIKGSDGWKITNELSKYVGNHKIICKPTFPSLELGNYLSLIDASEIHLVGLVSDICVISNAIIAKAACPNANIYIHKNLTSSSNLKMQKKSFELAENLHINVVDWERKKYEKKHGLYSKWWTDIGY